MAIEVKYTSDNLGIEFILSDTVYGRDIIDIHKQWHTLEILNNIKYKIVDRSRIDKFYASQEEVKAISELDLDVSSIFPDLVIAIISSSDIMDALAGLWEAYFDGKIKYIQRFYSREDAIGWIYKTLKL